MNVHNSKFCTLLVHLSVLLTLCACASGQKKLVSKEEVSVKFQHVGKPGTALVYAVDRTKIPNAPQLPNSYRPLGTSGYLISTDTLDLGNPTAFFKVAVNTAEEFAKVSVLRLAVNDMAPEGYEWQDCTNSLEVVRGQRDPKMLEERKDFDEWYTARMNKLLPDFTSRIVTCKPEDKWKTEEYFVLATRTAIPPSQPFTSLQLTVVNENQPDAKETIYQVSIKNTGPEDIANLSISSRFDVDVSVKTVVPDQGKCVKSTNDVSGRIAICQLGRIAAGSGLTILFTGSETGMSRTVKKWTLNIGWYIDAFFVKNPGDPFWWGANRSHYQPLADLPK